MVIQAEDGRRGRNLEVTGAPRGEGVATKAWRRVYPIVRCSREVHLASLDFRSEILARLLYLELDVKNAFLNATLTEETYV